MPDPGAQPRPWLRSYPPGVPPGYDYPKVPLTRFLDDAARDFPGVVATWYGGETLTYAQLLDATDRFAAALADRGVGPGTSVAIALGNLPAFPIAFFASHRLGATVVPISRHEEDKAIHHRLEDGRVHLLVCHTADVARVEGLRPRLPHLAHVVATGHQHWVPRWRRALAPPGRRRRYRRMRANDGVESMRALLAAHDADVRQASVAPDDVAVVQYSPREGVSPPGVALTHANLVANSFQARLWVPDIQAGNERVLAALPFAHPYGLTIGLLASVLSAATLVLLPRFRPQEAAKAIEQHRPSLFPAVPSMLGDLAGYADTASTDLTSLRACLTGGAALPADVARRLEAISGARVRQGYGLTEAAPLTHANPVYGRAVPDKIGLPVTDTVAVIVDPKDPSTVLEPGRTGELAVYGPQVMQGYWQRPDLTERALVDGWLLTGDRASVDEDGYFALAAPLHEVADRGGS